MTSTLAPFGVSPLGRRLADATAPLGLAVPGGRRPSVLGVVFVTVGTMRPPLALSPLVLFGRDCLEMGWVAARRLVAEVVDFVAFWDRPVVEGVGESVDVPGLVSDVSDAVSARSFGLLPDPATAGSVGHGYVSVQPLKQRHRLFGHSELLQNPPLRQRPYAKVATTRNRPL